MHLINNLVSLCKGRHGLLELRPSQKVSFEFVKIMKGGKSSFIIPLHKGLAKVIKCDIDDRVIIYADGERLCIRKNYVKSSWLSKLASVLERNE